MTGSMNEYRANLIEERLGGWITPAELHAMDLIESARRAYAATGNALFAWSALAMLLRPGARPEEQYREPIIAPDPVRGLPAWLAEYLNATARAVMAPLLELSPATGGAASGLAWCRRELEATGEILPLWAGLLLLRLGAGAELPAWIAAPLFRSARDLSDHMAGRDLARRPPASSGDKELSRWQAAGQIPRAAAPELLAALGFPLPPAARYRMGREVSAFTRAHARMAAASDFPIGFRLSQAPVRVSAFELLEAFGFPKRKGPNPFLSVWAYLRANDDAFFHELKRRDGATYEEAIRAAVSAMPGRRKAKEEVSGRRIERRIATARRLAAGLPARGA